MHSAEVTQFLAAERATDFWVEMVATGVSEARGVSVEGGRGVSAGAESATPVEDRSRLIIFIPRYPTPRPREIRRMKRRMFFQDFGMSKSSLRKKSCRRKKL